jgi:Cu-Zn family superoxide dismutase
VLLDFRPAAALLGIFGVLLHGCAPSPRLAAADLSDAAGKHLGKVALEEVDSGVRLRITVRGMAPGVHGMHIHESGVCTPPGFLSAGSHFNPFGGEHAAHHPAFPRQGHAGDLPNLKVDQNGDGAVDFIASGVNLRRGGHHSLLSGDGTSVVIHAHPDDMKSAPSGGAGHRIACGVIVRASTM